MTWTKLDDDFADRPEMLSVSRSARLLLIEMYLWGNRLHQDGRVPAAALSRLSDAEDPQLDAKELLEAGLLEFDSGTYVLDWSEQPTAEEVKERQAYRKGVQKRYRDRKERHNRGDHSMCDPRYCKATVTSNKTGHGTNNVTALVTNPRPVPSLTGDRGTPGGPRSSAERHDFIDNGDDIPACKVCQLPETNYGRHNKKRSS